MAERSRRIGKGLRGSAAVGAVAAMLALASGCGGSGGPEPAPAACLTTSSTYLKALDRAPGRVTVPPNVRISECVVPGQSGGELANVGSELIVAATRLASTVSEGGAVGEQAALRLGYLVGAVRRGAEGTGGIHSDLVRRLEATARLTSESADAAAYAEGLRAGLARG